MIWSPNFPNEKPERVDSTPPNVSQSSTNIHKSEFNALESQGRAMQESVGKEIENRKSFSVSNFSQLKVKLWSGLSKALRSIGAGKLSRHFEAKAQDFVSSKAGEVLNREGLLSAKEKKGVTALVALIQKIAPQELGEEITESLLACGIDRLDAGLIQSLDLGPTDLNPMVDDRPLLHWLIQDSDPAILPVIQFMIDQDAYGVLNSEGMNALHLILNNPELVPQRDILLQMVAEGCPDLLNEPTHWGEFPLEMAIKSDDLAAAKLLLEHGADPLMKRDGVPLFHKAVQGGNRELITAMINSNSDVLDSTNEAGETPVDIARKSGQTEILQFLNPEINEEDLD